MSKRIAFLIPMIILLIFTVSLTQATDTSSSSWLDPRNTGRSAYSGPKDNTLKWMVESMQLVPIEDGFPYIWGGFSGPEGTLIVEVGPVTGATTLYALGPDGETKWTLEMDEDFSPLGASPETIYIGSKDNEVLALNPDKTIQWSCKVGGFPVIGVLTEDGTIYVWAFDNNLYAINPNGAVKWSYRVGGWIGKPSVDNYGVYFRSLENLLSALNHQGNLRWSKPVGGVGMVALGDDGTVYFVSDNLLQALDPSGEIKWSWAADGELRSPAIAEDGTIYLPQLGKLYALSPEGQLKWTWTFVGEKWISLLTVDNEDTLYFSADNKLYSLNSSGDLEWSHDFGTLCITRGHPEIAEDGSFYLICIDKIYAFGRIPSAILPPPVRNKTFKIALIAGAIVIVIGAIYWLRFRR